SEKTKNACLKLMGNALDANREKILIANKKDIANMEISHSKALIERLNI
ncbi:MAG: gamma-glutamyl-phosphate reductase, partial [Methanosarcinales archaeon]|nr:gamma-glutamyl-phosphate reductase [Methanosarcinales archaeon]